MEKIVSDKTLIVTLDKKRSVAIKKDEINIDNKRIFRNFVKNIPRIYEGISYKDLAYKGECWMEEYQAVIVQGVGCALGSWDLVDYKSRIGIELDDAGLLPMNKGLKF